jgi:hypothetical protein
VFVPFNTATEVSAGLTAGAVLSLWCELVCLRSCVPLAVLVVFAAPCPLAAVRPADFPPPPEERTSTTATTTTITPPMINIVARAGERRAREEVVCVSERRARDSAFRRSACLAAAVVRPAAPSGVLRRGGSVGAGGREVETLRRGAAAPAPATAPDPGADADADAGAGRPEGVSSVATGTRE